MKLIRFTYNGNEELGFLLNESCIPFRKISDTEETRALLGSVMSYLENLPKSREHAEELIQSSQENHNETGIPLSEVQPLPILSSPKALIDFALTPKHMEQSAVNLISNEVSGLKKIIALKMIKGKVIKARNNPHYPYYKGNNCRISGENDEVIWPAYTSYLDIEPELAMIYGNEKEKIAGYVILNDLSARDVQVPELSELSLTRSKDFDNGIGSLLVTPDEIADPRNLSVSVFINEEKRWTGDTSNYQISPEEVIQYLDKVYSPLPGTIIGMGTIPDCCSIETDEWLEPGDSFRIEFENMGSLSQKIPAEVGPLTNTRWKRREKLNIYK